MFKKSGLCTPVLLAAFLASGIVLSTSQAQSTQEAAKPAAPAGQAAAPGTPTRYHPSRFSKRATEYYGLIWGVDSLSVKWAESGEVIRFSYRVLDPDRAAVLNDKKAEPSLIDPQAGVRMAAPSLDKVGGWTQACTAHARRA